MTGTQPCDQAELNAPREACAAALQGIPLNQSPPIAVTVE